jgi:secretion/DNA translocation related CpaE-like protein
VLGVESRGGLRWPDLAGLGARLQPGLLTSALPCAEGVAVLSWDRNGDAPPPSAAAMVAALDAGTREFDLVVVDLPRRFGEAERPVLDAARQVLLVVPAEVRAAAAAGRVARALEPLVADVRLVVRGPAPTGLAAEMVADSLGLPLAGEARAEPGLAEALDRGEPPGLRSRGPLASLSRRLVESVLAA